MVVAGSQSQAQSEWLSQAKATVLDLVVLAATGTRDNILGWMCAYLFHGNVQNCFSRYRDEDDEEHCDKDGGNGSHKHPEDAFGHIHACTPDSIIKHMEEMILYKTFIQLVDSILAKSISPSRDKCHLLKSKTKKLLLVVHPDKFNWKHPECADGVSNKATEMVARMFASAKSRCES
jgi:hypothetical protein